MQEEIELATVVVLEKSRCLWAADLESDTALTLIALISEDPSSWEEATSVWARYRTPVVCEFASSLPFEETKRETALDTLPLAEAWVVIDFETKRVFTGGRFQEVGRDAAFAMVEHESGEQHCPLSVHLPPWWELHEEVSVTEVNQPRHFPINKPKVNREFLYGDAFLVALAESLLETVKSPAWQQRDAREDMRSRYPFTIDVHRDWLMTPREDLDGRTPRELLHGAIKWSDRVVWGQQLRLMDGGPMVAAPTDWEGFASAPMGSQEMCIYFDLCREVIEAGWSWCESEEGILARQQNESALAELTQHLRDAKDNWLNSPLERGAPPSVVIEYDRRRVPYALGVPVEGIESAVLIEKAERVPTNEHVDECDCPLCEMMDDGMFGVGFSAIDGHHLELDNEFAFSMQETREDWEEQQHEFAEFSAAMDRKEAEGDDDEDDEDDPFVSSWSGIGDDEPIPGDQGGFIKLAFMTSEIVSDLHGLDADRDEIKTLNAAFKDYRRSDGSPQAASLLKDCLQTLGERYPELVSKSADLQSRIDEASRASTVDDTDRDFLA